MKTMLLSLLLVSPVFAADKIVASSQTSMSLVAARNECAAPAPGRAKKVLLDDDLCVIVRQERPGQRSCQFVSSNERTMFDRDKLERLCRTTVMGE